MRPELSIIEKNTLNAINVNIGSDVIWEVVVEKGSNETSNSKINWSYYSINTERIILIQRTLLQRWNPKVLSNETTISESEFKKADTILRMLTFVESHYPKQALNELSRNDWISIAINMLFLVWEGKNSKSASDNPKYILTKRDFPLSKQFMKRVVKAIKVLFQIYSQGHISDGPEFEITCSSVKRDLKPILGEKYDEWDKGGSYASIQFTVAHLLLADALEILNSDRTQELLAYFEVVREINEYDLVKYFWQNYKKNSARKYRLTGKYKYLETSKNDNRENIRYNRANYVLGLKLHQKLSNLQVNTKQKAFIFPWLTHADLVRDYVKLRTAIYIIFLSVMGKRGPSEVRTLRAIDITPHDNAKGSNTLMRPSISKTHKGLRQEQGVTNCIDHAFSILLKLGYIDKTNSKIPLFTSLYKDIENPKQVKRISTNCSITNLNFYYKQFCIRSESKVDFLVTSIQPQITSHQFRHSFAEFALRRFDGNVEELIRQHFCHSPNHWWIKRYTADKLDSDAITRMNRSYIQELIPRILNDTNCPEFVGGMALYIKKTFSDKTQVLTPSETEERIKTLCDEFIQVTPHEYGWCLLNKNHSSLAQCKDNNNIPNPSATSSDKCNSCANFVSSRKSHLTTQTKIAISHCDFLEQDTWSMPSLKKKSKEAISAAIKLFPELKTLVEE